MMSAVKLLCSLLTDCCVCPLQRKEPTQILVNTIVKVVPSSRGSVGTFEVHHKGKGSPWILDAETEVGHGGKCGRK